MKNILRILAVSALSFISFLAHGQSVEEQQKRKTDIPGTFVIEVGVNSPLGASSEFSTQLFGSRTANVYYVYDEGLSILTRHLKFVPGIGLGLDRYKFKNNYILDYSSGSLVMAESENGIKKSQLVTNYVDLPLGLRYIGNPANQRSSFNFEGGFRAGYLIGSFTKTKYTLDGEKVKEKIKRGWELEKFRCGLYAKTGVGNFNVLAYYNMSRLFKAGKAPDGDDINTLTVGISIGGF